MSCVARADELESDTSQYAAIAKGRIDIPGGLIELAARRDGVIRDVFVEEGAEVRAGQALAILDDQEARLMLSSAEKSVDMARAALDLTNVQLTAAERRLQRMKRLRETGTVSVEDYDDAKDAVARLKAERGVASSSLNIAQAEAEVARFDVEQRVIRAPLDGIVLRQLARPGDGVSTLNVTPLFWFAPNLPRIVRGELEEAYARSVYVGMTADIVSEGQLNIRTQGEVSSVGDVFLRRRPALDDPNNAADVRVIEFTVALTQAQPFLLGERVLVRLRESLDP